MTSRTKALIAIVLAALLWSTAGFAKIVVRSLDPYVAAFLRFFVASVVIFPFFLKTKKHKHFFRDLVPLSLASTANILLYYIGLQTSTASSAVLISAGVPLVTSIFAHMLIKEQLTPHKLIGIIIGLVGVIFIALLPIIEKGNFASGNIVGNTFFIASVFVWSIYTIGSRRAIDKQGHSPLIVSGVSIFTSTIVFFFISIFTFKPSYIQIVADPSMIFLILHLGINITVATYLLFQWAIKHSSATTTSLNTYLQPMFALGINTLFLGEKITLPLVFGAAIVLSGVMITSGKKLILEARGWVSRN